MFSIIRTSVDTFSLVGRFDAAQAESAALVLGQLESSGYLDFSECSYIASAGLGVLFATQKRLHGSGHSLVLRNLSRHQLELFELAGFDKLFTIEHS